MSRVTLELVFSWNIDHKFSFHFFVSTASRLFSLWNEIWTSCSPAYVIHADMFADKFEFKVCNSFITISVVTNDSAVDFIADVILSSIKNDIWLALSCSQAKETPNFVP